MNPLVSAIIPTQRRPAMLRTAAASVMGQTFQDLELIVVLNDATPEAIETAREIAQAPNVRLLHLKRGNVSSARNAGLAAAKGKWIAFLDDDDEWLPTKIEEQLREALESSADFIACDLVKFDETGDLGPLGGSIPASYSLNEALTIYNYLPGSASGALIRTKTIVDLGGFDERMHACEDWDMFRRLSWDHRISRVHKVLARYRIHKASMSRRRSLMLRAELWHLIKMTFDTPAELRHVVPRAYKAMFWREAANVYAALNELTGGRAQLFYRRYKDRRLEGRAVHRVEFAEGRQFDKAAAPVPATASNRMLVPAEGHKLDRRPERELPKRSAAASVKRHAMPSASRLRSASAVLPGKAPQP